MGFKNGITVHYRDGGVCRPFKVLDDHAPDYNQLLSGLEFAPGPLGIGATITYRTDVEHDTINLVGENYQAALTNGKWHYMPDECPSFYA